MSTLDTVFNSISAYAVAGKANDDAFAGLRDTAAEVFRRALSPDAYASEFLRECREAEDEFMEANYGADPAAKHNRGKRNGQWKYRTYLPGAYNTAKSELSKALEAGIDPEGKGKTAIAKERNKVSTPTTPEARIKRALTTIKNALAELSGTDRTTAEALIRAELDLY